MNGPVVSVVIPTFGRPETAAAAAASALAQDLGGRPFEVLVVDDGGKDATRAAVEALPGKPGTSLRYLWMEHAGPAAARNRGAREARGAILAFLDSDTLARPGWLAAGVRDLEADPALSLVEGVVDPDGEGPPTPFSEIVSNHEGGRFLTCNLFVRREGFLALGGFDERFKRPCREDTEFGFRSCEAGLKWVFERSASVTHPRRECRPGRRLQRAREGMYEALLERRHPRSYYTRLKWIDGWQVPAYYLAHYAALPALALGPAPAAGALAAGAAATLAAWCRKTRWGWADVLRLLPEAVAVPYVRLAWVFWGYGRYPRSPE